MLYSDFISKYENKVQENDLWSKLVDKVKMVEKYTPIDWKDFISGLESFEYKEELMEEKGKIEYLDNKFVLTINFTYAKSVQNFTLIHELAHAILHESKLKEQGFLESNFMENEIVHDNYEIEANQFASELLVPEKDVLVFVSESIDRKAQNNEKLYIDEFLKMCANRYEVSLSMLEYRLKNIGII